MPYFFVLYFWLILLIRTPLNKVSRSNELIKEAETSYLQKNHILALVKYRYLNNSLRINNNNILLNLAHCYFINNDTAQAKKYYQHFERSRNKNFQAVACQQLGVLAFEEKDYTASLNYFKQAIQADPANDEIRFNFELVKKAAARQQKNDKKQPSTPAEPEKPAPLQHLPPEQNEPETTPNPENQEQNKQKTDETEKRLKKINLSPEKAQMILDAMKNSEAQYIQQKKKVSSQQKEKTYPDW